ncbi:MAG TPA: hypothetical protein VGH63_18685 [Polyangia bacterium]
MPERETTNPALAHADLKNLLLFLDDDVRESAKALVRVERYLGRALALLDDGAVSADKLEALAGEQDIFDDLHTLVDTLGSLRGRMGKVASTLRRT